MNNVAVLNQLQAKIGSADWSKWGVYRWEWWDYVRYPAAGTTTPLQFFINPLGGVDPVSGLQKTIEQTNMPKARTFGQTYFILQAIRTHVFILPKKRQPSAIATDATVIFDKYTGMMEQFNDLLGTGVLNFNIGQKDYFEIGKPFVHAPPGFGPEIIQHGAVNQFAAWTTQSNHDKDIWAVTPAQMIEPEQTIDVSIQFPQGNPAVFTNLVDSASPSVDVGIILSGYLARPSQ